MPMIFIFIFLFSSLSFSQDKIDEPNRWRGQVYGGVLIDTLDLEARENYEHQISESPMFGLDVFHSLYFSRNRFQFFYGGGLQYLKSVDRLGGNHIETTVLSLVGQSGLFWRPFSDSHWGFGASLGIYLYSEGESRLKTGSINRPVRKDSGLFGGSGPTPFFEAHLWALYQWHPQWEGFVRLESFNYAQNFGTSLGVAYGF